MLESLNIQTHAPAPASGGLAAGPGTGDAGDKGAFENMLQAGLADRSGSDAAKSPTTVPAEAKSAAKSSDKSEASADDQKLQPDENAESASLTALLAYSTGVVATILPAVTRLLPNQAGSALAGSVEAAPAGSLPGQAEPALAGPADLVPALAGSPTADTTSAAGTDNGGSNAKPEEVIDTTSDRLATLLAHGAGSSAMPAAADSSTDAASFTPAIVPPEPVRTAPPEPARTAASDTPAPSAQAARQAAGFALAKDPAAPAASDAGTAKTGFADSLAVPRARDGAAAAKNAADDRPAKQAMPARREDLRGAADNAVADTSRQREDLLNALQPAHSGQTGDRPADRPVDVTARIDALNTMVRGDMARGPDSFSSSAPERTGPVSVVYVEQGVASAGWKQEFGSQVTLLVSRREPQAEIRLNPPQLGPVEVRIGLQGDQVSLAFAASHPDTRAAIENALPQLRELFAGNGLALGNASVSAESSQQHSPRGTYQSGVSRPIEESVMPDNLPALTRVDMRLVDTFA